jgi:Family of unknown function (DUF6941)
MPRVVPVLSGCLFFALALSGNPARAVADAQFLGIAVAHAIHHDASGNTVLIGIHQTALVSSFPHEESVSVYTRWSGSGTHDIGISIWNMDTEETVSETDQEVDFAPGGVTSFVHIFPRATFPARGTYAVEVTLDGDLAAEYSLYVNSHDTYPDTPELVLSVPARDATLDKAGDVSVNGIPDVVTVPHFPARRSFDLVTLWFSGEEGHVQHVEILDPTGVPIARSPVREIGADYGKLEPMTDSLRNVPLAVSGTYTVVLYMDGEDIFEYPLPITDR